MPEGEEEPDDALQTRSASNHDPIGEGSFSWLSALKVHHVLKRCSILDGSSSRHVSVFILPLWQELMWICTCFAGDDEAGNAEEQVGSKNEEEEETQQQELNPNASAEPVLDGMEAGNVLRTWRQFLNEDILKTVYTSVKAVASAESARNFRVRLIRHSNRWRERQAGKSGELCLRGNCEISWPKFLALSPSFN